VRRAKEKAMDEKGRLACEACGFDFALAYGEVGRGFIEGHHLSPLADLAAERRSRITDLALVCPDCHRIIHRKRPWLRLDQLASILATAFSLTTASHSGACRPPSGTSDS
jgi:predicted HNH restriction endonuclease